MKTLTLVVTIALIIAAGCTSLQSDEDTINKNTTDSITSSTTNKPTNSELTPTEEVKTEDQSIAMPSVPKPDELSAQIENNELPVVFHGFGTAPFWDIFITADYLLYNELIDNSFYSYALLNLFDKDKVEQVIKFQDSEGKTFELTIEKKPTDDGMSEKIYPYSTTWSEMSLNGAGELVK